MFFFSVEDDVETIRKRPLVAMCQIDSDMMQMTKKHVCVDVWYFLMNSLIMSC